MEAEELFLLLLFDSVATFLWGKKVYRVWLTARLQDDAWNVPANANELKEFRGSWNKSGALYEDFVPTVQWSWHFKDGSEF